MTVAEFNPVFEARKGCTNDFINQILLPRVARNSKPLSLEEIIISATSFKTEYKQSHPQLGEWELLPDTELKLLSLLEQSESVAETNIEVLQSSCLQLKKLLDHNEGLLSI